MKDNKLKGKDLINIGIYAAIYCLLMTCIAMLGYIPIMMPMLAVIVPWIYNKKVDKYDKIEDRKRRNKKCLQKIRNTPRNISKQ